MECVGVHMNIVFTLVWQGGEEWEKHWGTAPISICHCLLSSHTTPPPPPLPPLTLVRPVGPDSGAIGRAVDRYLRGPGFDPQSGLNFICSPVPTQHLMGS
ncbi:hypothetical protein ElyMa_003409800 [Elysia marginata]|uniref:Uncharacterized protein n=1 Tax=Elysia marginata TaxID=1093978 RepID=A0AAV4JRU7_9GAST|nr:hypothetical protein ElyMa_003409800 [Elysia marginata]